MPGDPSPNFTQSSPARLRGPAVRELERAYDALARGDIASAARTAFDFSKDAPTNPHPWIILGGAALTTRKGGEATAFFREAERHGANLPLVHEGLAKAALLDANPVQALRSAETAFSLGSEDAGLLHIFVDLMSIFGRQAQIAEIAGNALRAVADPELCLAAGYALVDADEFRAAVEWFEEAWRLAPETPSTRLAHLAALVLSNDLTAADAFYRAEEAAGRQTDAMVALHMRTLRETGRHDAALRLVDSHPFTDANAFAQAQGVAANIHQDRGDADATETAYREAVLVTGAPGKVAKAFGTFLFREGRFAEGVPFYAQRFDGPTRAMTPETNAAPENLEARERIFLRAEQGVGDQLALLSLLAWTPLDAARQQIFFVAEPRFDALLAGNTAGVSVLSRERFQATVAHVDKRELVYLGDLTRYLDGVETPFAGPEPLIVPDARRVAELRSRYRGYCPGRIFGVAWHSANPLGHLRGIALERLLAEIPKGALVINLQYGQHDAEIEAARATRPDLRFITDESVDQMTDLAGFAAQLAAIDTVLSIDNTTVHMCGALKHPDTHVLIPAGSECMWYWGRAGDTDRFYGCLKLHRHASPQDWTASLASLRAAL
ncbi:tetratricopeptide repeat protein [Litorisediminicola beolgyonensis]|uniref:Tetratricopeptide repeat protein n=1 Tax=Litorisediminicola beolgyonensis TaxID=1173614 RepID=A0ABW3ZFS8_9RHOB